MKLTLIALLLGLMQVSATVYSQTTKFSFELKEKQVVDVLREIENNSNFRFFYQREQVNVERKVNIDVEDNTVEEILTALFKDRGIEYKVLDNDLVVLVPENVKLSEVLTPAMQKSITGTVTDADGKPLPGLTVVIKGTTQGVITDMDGKYTINGIPGDAVLQFSFIGMKTQEIPVEGKTVIDVSMEVDAFGIEEVVTIGYGTQRRQSVSGSVNVADLETFREVPVNNVLEMVKGTLPGLNVGATNTAGQEAGLSIRGQNSYGASNKPLIVVDGAIYNGSLNDIQTEDIEDFTILKDAAAAAVYGSRSANGVILIETKKGKGIDGKARFSVKLSYGLANELEPLELYDTDGYLERLIDINAFNGVEVDEDNIDMYLSEYERENYNATPDHQPTLEDPYQLIRQQGFNRKANISISNSTEKSNYYISLSGTDQEGVTINDQYKNVAGRINISSQLADWFNLGIKSFYSYRDYSGDSPGISWATGFSPWAKVYDEDGTYEKFPNTTTSYVSPFWDIRTVDTDKRHQLNGVVDGTFRIPGVSGLSYNLKFAGRKNWRETSWFNDLETVSGEGKNGQGARTYSTNTSFLIDHLLTYNKVYDDKHDLGLTFLYSVEQNHWENMSAEAENFENMVLEDYKLENGTTQKVNTGGGESANIGGMARLAYTYDRRYSFTGLIRRDGYSGFSQNKKWGNFYSLGATWNINNESFMDGNDIFDALVLRYSYGSTGNQALDPYSTLAKVGTSKYILSGQDGYTITQYISTLAANDLGWEATTGTNLGIDFAVVNNRISGSLEGYKTSTTDLIFERSIPKTSGYSKTWDNIGEIQNKGFDLSLHTVNIQKNDFQWISDFAFSLNRNKLVSVDGTDEDGDGIEDDKVSDGLYIGKSLGTIYSSKIIGIYQQEDEDNGTILTGMRPGDYILEDISGADGEPDGKINSYDRQFQGTTKENFRWSWTNTFYYKDFTLMAYIYSIWGGDEYYQGSVTPYNDAYVMRTDVNHPIYDYWTPENTGAEFPRLDYRKRAAYRGTKRYDRSFIKLQKISLSYTLDKYVKPIGINNMLLSVSADNLALWAKEYPGLDPETGQGLNANSRPSMRTYLFTLSFNF